MNIIIYKLAMPDYKQGKIYKLCSDVSPLSYVGSTCNSLSKRKNEHKGHSKLQPERRVYKHINQIGWQYYEIILIENYPCNDKNELRARERYYKDLLKPELNKNNPLENQNDRKIQLKNYRQTHKEKINQCQKKCREKHKEHYQEYQKTFEETHKEQLQQYRKTYREKHQQYQKTYQKAYQEKYKEYRNQYQKTYGKAYQENHKEYLKLYHQMHYLNQKLKKTDEEYNKVINEWNLLKHNTN